MTFGLDLPLSVLQTLVPHGQPVRETNCCVMMHQHQQHLSGGGPFLKCCEQQAEDRCYRIVQKNPVAVALVVAKESVEDKGCEFSAPKAASFQRLWA